MSYSQKTVPILIIALMITTSILSSSYTSADDSQVILSVDNEHLDVLIGNNVSFTFLLILKTGVAAPIFHVPFEKLRFTKLGMFFRSTINRGSGLPPRI